MRDFYKLAGTIPLPNIVHLGICFGFIIRSIADLPTAVLFVTFRPELKFDFTTADA
jgi:hypothetical protein